MTIREIDKFIGKLHSAELDGEAARYRVNAIQYLNLMCREVEYIGKKSIPLKEDEAEQ